MLPVVHLVDGLGGAPMNVISPPSRDRRSTSSNHIRHLQLRQYSSTPV
jgi:hypothetical protein